MTTGPAGGTRRADALSKERIVEAAIAMLDAGGEGALTFRALTARLATGVGALYWHVAGKEELLAAATDEILARVLTEVAAEVTPPEAIRTIALGMFDAIDAHPWVGAQLSRAPTAAALLTFFEAVGGQLRALGVPQRARFDAASALVSYVLGVAGQNATNARLGAHRDRAVFLGKVADRWARLDPARFPFAHEAAEQLRDHDDREQFLAGIDLILAGIAALPDDG